MKKLLLDIIFHPRKYDHVIGLPMAFDAAEILLNNYWDELTDKQADKVEFILLRSGKYE